ncbi:MAG TPA: histidine kinase [Daejeonella sp.]
MQNRREVDELLVISLPDYWVYCASFIGLFYLNNFVLIPRLYIRKRYGLFFGCILLLCCLFNILKPFDRLLRAYRNSSRADTENVVSAAKPDDTRNITSNRRSNRLILFDIVSFFLFFTLIALSMAIQIKRQWRLTERQVIRAEADKAEAELMALKAQINPHFLFNTLNSLYTLALTNNQSAAEGILKLSNIMRYITDDAAQQTVSLQDDIDCLANYISLQRVRLGNKIPISFDVSGDLAGKRVAPLIMMTFIENIFKNGISKHEEAPVFIQINVDKETITLFCQNRIFKNHIDVERSGIGMANTRKRLAHAYPGRHLLNINTDDGLYTVNLCLKI